MHVHERNPKRTLITILLFALIIVFGWVTMKKPRFKYTLTPQQTVDMVINHRGCFHPYELEKVLNNKEGDVVLIDIRNNFDYAKGHIPGSLNITAANLLSEENIKQLDEWKKNNVKVVFYHDNQLQANGAWMLFRQIGYSNTYVLLGGYQYYALHKNNLKQSEGSCLKGTAKYDYAAVAKKRSAVSGEGSSAKPAKKVKVRRKKKEKAASGGC
jgi:rhodanese-related sulfurtransferase